MAEKGRASTSIGSCQIRENRITKISDRNGIANSSGPFTPGTSKWNKIEHRRFCHIRENWRGRPLINREFAVNLISNTTNSKGLKLQANLDEAEYPIGKKISDKDLKWNYSILPNID
jgi:hypothetical protein